jgi:hypothetical protein
VTNSQPPSDASPFQDAVRRTKTAWGWLNLVVSILTLGVGAVIAGKINPFLSFWQTICLTLPLLVAVAIVTYRDLVGLKISVLGACGILAATIAATYLVGFASGSRVVHALFPPITASCSITNTCKPWQASPPEVIWALVKLYGLTKFLVGIGSGIFLGFTAASWSYLWRPTPSK